MFFRQETSRPKKANSLQPEDAGPQGIHLNTLSCFEQLCSKSCCKEQIQADQKQVNAPSITKSAPVVKGLASDAR